MFGLTRTHAWAGDERLDLLFGAQQKRVQKANTTEFPAGLFDFETLGDFSTYLTLDALQQGASNRCSEPLVPPTTTHTVGFADLFSATTHAQTDTQALAGAGEASPATTATATTSCGSSPVSETSATATQRHQRRQAAQPYVRRPARAATQPTQSRHAGTGGTETQHIRMQKKKKAGTSSSSSSSSSFSHSTVPAQPPLTLDVSTRKPRKLGNPSEHGGFTDSQICDTDFDELVAQIATLPLALQDRIRDRRRKLKNRIHARRAASKREGSKVVTKVTNTMLEKESGRLSSENSRLSSENAHMETQGIFYSLQEQGHDAEMDALQRKLAALQARISEAAVRGPTEVARSPTAPSAGAGTPTPTPTPMPTLISNNLDEMIKNLTDDTGSESDASSPSVSSSSYDTHTSSHAVWKRHPFNAAAKPPIVFAN